jgi:hypothetical protein
MILLQKGKTIESIEHLLKNSMSYWKMSKQYLMLSLMNDESVKVVYNAFKAYKVME